MQDLTCHVSSCQGGSRVNSYFFCGYQECEYATKGFARNDDCLRHMRLKHGCPNGLESIP